MRSPRIRRSFRALVDPRVSREKAPFRDDGANRTSGTGQIDEEFVRLIVLSFMKGRSVGTGTYLGRDPRTFTEV